jgi:hypothetical protein
MLTSLLITALFIALVWAIERSHRQPGRTRWFDRDVVARAADADREYALQVASRPLV